MKPEFEALKNVVIPEPDSDQNVETFAQRLTASCHSHKQWLAVVRFGLGTLIQTQQLLITLIDQEAAREVRRGASQDYVLHRIFHELNLRVAIGE